MKYYFIYSHPNYTQSKANAMIYSMMQKHLDAEYCCIDKAYTFDNIDVEKEQSKLLAADVIVFQFPLYYGNITPMLCQYLLKVFCEGFAYKIGEPGKLVSKKFRVITTAANAESAYGASGFKPFTPEEDLTFLKSTIHFIRAKSFDFNVFYSSHNVDEQRVEAFVRQFINKEF